MATSRTFRGVIVAILTKDARSLGPVLLLTALLQAMAIVASRADLWPVLTAWLPTLLIIVNSVVIFSVIQTDPPVSLTDDWLCRPVSRGGLLIAKLLLLTLVIYLPRVLTTLAIDLLRQEPLGAALLDALLLQSSFEPLYLPIVLMAAVCTASMLEGVGVLLAVFVAVFVIPTPFISPPGPEDLTVGEAMQNNGLQWLSMFPGKLIFMIAAATCLWFAYARRSSYLARVTFAAGLVAGIAVIVAPMLWLPWQFGFGLQQALHADSDRNAQAAEPALRHTRACFPAARLGEIAEGGESENARALFALDRWGDEQLKAAGKDAVAFTTQVRPRGLPDEWRLQVAYAWATYRAPDERPIAQLSPAFHAASSSNGFGGEKIETLTHAWLLPQTVLQRLDEGAEPTLDLAYSVAVLEPTSAQLRVDGKNRRLPGIGTCRAMRDTLEDRITVECLAVGRPPAMIAAELNGVPASRVDSKNVDLAPWPLRLVQSRRVTLSIGSPDLVESEIVKLSAYRANAFKTVHVRSPGWLGDIRENCPAVATHSTAARLSSWNDRSAHDGKVIAVENDVQLEVLDWGGTGTALVLLPGLGATAHSFDEIGPLLAQHFRVVGITRRGIGYSSRPDHGYSQARLAQDVIEVMDALGIGRAVFAGHSIAGEELSTLGARHAGRVAGLIYLDAAYDRSLPLPQRYRELSAALPDRPRPLPEELSSYASLLGFFDRTGADPLPEGELIALWNVDKRYLAGQRSVDSRAIQAIEAGISSPDYRSITAPALAIYATSAGPDGMLKPWHDATDATLRQKLRELQSMRDALQRREIEKFRAELKGARVLELPGASHWVMLSHRDAVLQAIVDFVAALPVT